MKLKARISFSIENIVKDNEIQDLNLSRLKRNVNWKTKKCNYKWADLVLIVPKSDSQVYCFKFGTLVYNNDNYNHVSAKSLFSLIKEGYVTIKKVVGKSGLEFRNELGIVLERHSLKKTLPNLTKCINNVSKKLFSEYKILDVDKSKNYINVLLIPTPKQPTLADYLKNK